MLFGIICFHFLKQIFSALRGLVWSKNKGGGAPWAPPPGPPLLLTIKRMQYGLTFFPLRKFQQQTDQTFLGKEANLSKLFPQVLSF